MLTNTPGGMQVETTASADASTVARMGRLVEAAAAQRSPLEGAVARFAKYYTPLVLLTALCIAFLPWAAGRSNHKARYPPHMDLSALKAPEPAE